MQEISNYPFEILSLPPITISLRKWEKLDTSGRKSVILYTLFPIDKIL